MQLLGRLISISGVDGSGKTTQIELLLSKAKELTTNSIVVWSRWRPLTSLPLLALMKRLGYAKVHRTSSIGFVETQVAAKTGLASLWCLLTQIDNLMKTGLKVMIPLILGRTVICDRYVLDLLVENMADLHDTPTTSRIGHRLLKLLPQPDLAFLIEVDPRLAFRRKPDMPTLAHFSERIALYHTLAEKMGIERIDGNQTPEAIHNHIWSKAARVVHP